MTTPFTDIGDQKPYEQDAIGWAFRHGITNGTSPSTFSPDRACTRADTVVFLQRAFAAAGLLDDADDPIWTPDPIDPGDPVDPVDPDPDPVDPDPDPVDPVEPDPPGDDVYDELVRRGLAAPGHPDALSHRGLLTLPENMTRLSGKIVPTYGDIVSATGGYISMQHPGVGIRDYYLPNTGSTPQTGDHCRTDAVKGSKPVGNVWSHLYLGGKPTRQGSVHLDSWQGYSDQGSFIGSQRFENSIIHGSLSGCLFSKHALAADAWFEIYNCWVGQMPGASCVKLYSREGINTFRARRSDIAEVELIDVDEDGNPTRGGWIIDIVDCDIPGGVTLNGQPVDF